MYINLVPIHEKFQGLIDFLLFFCQDVHDSLEAVEDIFEASRGMEETELQIDSILSDSDSSECDDAREKDVEVFVRREVFAYTWVR